jgi:hypothetical protein
VRISPRSVPLFSGSAAVLAAMALLVAAAATASTDARAAGPIGVIVLKEHGVGTSQAAQPFLDKLVDVAAKENGWSGAKGQFHTKRDAAETWIQAEKPHYGIISLGAFLAWKGKLNVDSVGQAMVSGGGGQQYFLISKTASDLAGCKGKKLASDHADDPRFIDKVVSGGQFKLSDFTLDQTTRPLQTTKKVVNDEDDCALIDDAQLAELQKLNTPSVKQVWSSAKLPSMIVASFPGAPAAEATAFQASLPKICAGAGKQVCTDVGLQSLSGPSPSDLPALIAAYNK